MEAISVHTKAGLINFSQVQKVVDVSTNLTTQLVDLTLLALEIRKKSNQSLVRSQLKIEN